MSESKSGNGLVWAALIGALGTIVVTIINKCPAEPAVEKTEKVSDPQPSSTQTLSPGKPNVPATDRSPGISDAPKPRPQNTQAEEVVSQISGRIVDADGRSVAGVKVRCTSCLSSDKTALSNEDGYFSLPYRIAQSNSIQQLMLLLSKGGLTKTSEESASQKNVTIVF